MCVGSLPVHDEDWKTQYFIILIDNCVAPSVIFSQDIACGIQFQDDFLPQSVRGFDKAVSGIIIKESYISFCIRFTDTVVIPIICIGKSVTQGIRTGKDIVHLVISELCFCIQSICNGYDLPSRTKLILDNPAIRCRDRSFPSICIICMTCGVPFRICRRENAVHRIIAESRCVAFPVSHGYWHTVIPIIG